MTDDPYGCQIEAARALVEQALRSGEETVGGIVAFLGRQLRRAPSASVDVSIITALTLLESEGKVVEYKPSCFRMTQRSRN